MPHSNTILGTRRIAVLTAATLSVLVAVLGSHAADAQAPTAQAPAAPSSGQRTTVEIYDDFDKPRYSQADYVAKWANIYGPGELAAGGTSSFARGAFSVSAVPFKTANDVSVFDHLKYIAISTKTFPVPTDGSVEISSTIKASTPGTQPGRVIHGTYTESGAPYAQPTLEGQQAGVVMNVIDFSTGQLFDWFVSGHTAFPLIERLPSNVTGNAQSGSPDYVGTDKMYTQIIKEIPASPGAHTVSIRFSRAGGVGSVDYFFDGKNVAHVDHVGIPLDVQGVPFTGTYPSLGAGEELGSKIDSLAIGHGLFSLLDAFPFQHPDAPALSVSIPPSERLFGQGATGTFDDFKVKTVSR
ncbi:MAG TPA: DUF6081 family protein [Nocardioides sp.]|uniref:DUF6081 family protein n=1 Tax=Nocardioides sp. TaxID=35761 RepID=UPI002E37AA13|nr:DUF6081 family protein [Nocardioides sp.]HEX5086406.1 DUF6081 family protein [Nocardioides sp.]